MSNRYSKTGFTAREDARLLKIEKELLTIIGLRSGKDDDRMAISRLFQAQGYISDARYRSKQWKKDQ